MGMGGERGKGHGDMARRGKSEPDSSVHGLDTGKRARRCGCVSPLFSLHLAVPLLDHWLGACLVVWQ